MLREGVEIISQTFAKIRETSVTFGQWEPLGYGHISRTVAALSRQKFVVDWWANN